jgi:acetylornithine deacetylase/succinyl-diaminopimelate desuccinylase-like protein
MDITTLAQEVIATHSVTTEGTRPLAEFLADSVLPALDLEVSFQEGDTRQDVNLLAWKPGRKNLPALLLTSHLDTVPPGDPSLWTKTNGDPFSPVVEDDRLYGLGSADAKLDWLAKAQAISRFQGKAFLRPLLFVGTYGEERGLVGARGLLAAPPAAIGYVFAGEPTELKLVHAHKGLAVLRLSLSAPQSKVCRGAIETITVPGRSAHSSTPHLGENAIGKALQLFANTPYLLPVSLHGGDAVNKVPARCEVQALNSEILNPQADISPLHPELVSFLTTFFAGLDDLAHTFTNTMPEFSPATLTWNVGELHAERTEATLLFDLRPLPGQSPEALVSWIQSLLSRLLSAHPQVNAVLELKRRNPPLSTPLDAAIFTESLRIMAEVDLPLATATKAGCTEAGLYGERGIPAVVFGAGMAGGNIHAPNEWTSLSQLRRSVDFYAAIIEALCCSDSLPHP